MSRNIYWTPESEKTLNQNLAYLEQEWDTVVLNEFLDRIEDVLKRISENPLLYPVYMSHDRVHRCVINEHLTLYYRIVDEVNIDLLAFWNTHQNPSKLRL